MHYMSRGDDLDAAEREIVRRNVVAFRQELSEAYGEEVTQQGLANLSGLSIDAIRGYEQARRMPDRRALMRLAGVFGRAVEDFFNPDPPPPNPMKRQGFAVRFKILGTPPPGFQEDVERLLAKYTPDAAAKQAAEKKKMLQGTVPPKPRRRS